MNSIQDFITSDPATQKAAQSDLDLNAELGLVVPDNVLTENLPLWQTFFRTLRNMYRNEMLTKEEIHSDYIPAFLSIPDSRKQGFLNDLANQVDQQLKEITEAETIITLGEVQDKINKILSLLPPDLQLEFTKQINGGTIPDEVQRQIGQYLGPGESLTPEEEESYAQARLANALDKRKVLDARKFNTPLPPEKIQDIVDQHERFTRPITPTPQPRPTAPISQPTFVPQPNYPRPVVAPAPAQPIVTPIISAPTPQPTQIYPTTPDSTYDYLEDDQTETAQSKIPDPISIMHNRKSNMTLDDLLNEK
jgi:hypothetical protein